jgi:hypothetical protein
MQESKSSKHGSYPISTGKSRRLGVFLSWYGSLTLSFRLTLIMMICSQKRAKALAKGSKGVQVRHLKFSDASEAEAFVGLPATSAAESSSVSVVQSEVDLKVNSGRNPRSKAY